MSPNKKSRPGSHPEPYIVEPLQGHKQTVILLHGRGSNGQKFGSELVEAQTTLSCIKTSLVPGENNDPLRALHADTSTLRTLFPNAKFIFPTAKKRRAKWYNRTMINQWFDSVPIDEQDDSVPRCGMSIEEENWQLEGLRESREYVKRILDEEVRNVGGENVVLGGLSQGCAMALWVLMSYDDEAGELGECAGGECGTRLRAFVGMSGWLPFADEIEGIVDPARAKSKGGKSFGVDEVDVEDDDPFARSEDEGETLDGIAGTINQTGKVLKPVAKVRNFIRDSLDLPPTADQCGMAWQRTPVFLGHGMHDEKVKMAKGRRAAECLETLGIQVTWKEYDEGHWYKVPEEIDDIGRYLQAYFAE